MVPNEDGVIAAPLGPGHHRGVGGAEVVRAGGAGFCWAAASRMWSSNQRPANRSGGRSPAMAAGLADHVWTMREWLTYPSIQRR
mgnify:CR=1 FL=1